MAVQHRLQLNFGIQKEIYFPLFLLFYFFTILSGNCSWNKIFRTIQILRNALKLNFKKRQKLKITTLVNFTENFVHVVSSYFYLLVMHFWSWICDGIGKCMVADQTFPVICRNQFYEMVWWHVYFMWKFTGCRRW